MVLFSPDAKYKVDSLNLYIIGNYVKRTIPITTEDIYQPKSNQLNFHYYLCSVGIEKRPKIAVQFNSFFFK